MFGRCFVWFFLYHKPLISHLFWQMPLIFFLAVVMNGFKNSFYREKYILFIFFCMDFTFYTFYFLSTLVIWKCFSTPSSYVFLINILYSMFLPTRFILWNKWNEMPIVSFLTTKYLLKMSLSHASPSKLKVKFDYNGRKMDCGRRVR